MEVMFHVIYTEPPKVNFKETYELDNHTKSLCPEFSYTSNFVCVFVCVSFSLSLSFSNFLSLCLSLF